MKVRAHRVWLAAGLAAALPVAAPWVPLGTALAQTAISPNLGPWPTTTRPDRPRSQTAAALAGDPLPVARFRRADPDDGDEQPAPASESDEAREPVEPQDGLLDPVEPQPVLDGLDPNAIDMRSEEERQAFVPAEPPAGYDPRSFSIEPDPATDRRPERLARIDPYDATGVKLGSFILYPEAEIGAGGFNNLLRAAQDRRDEIALEVRPGVRAVSTWGVHAIELGARGLASFHSELPSEDDRAWTIEGRGRLDITRRTNIEASLSHDVAQETRGTINSRSGFGGRPDVTTDRLGAALNHRFNRLRLQLRGAVTERDHAPDPGLAISNDDRDATLQEAAIRASWDFKPELSVFGEGGRDERDYRSASRGDGLRRDSSGERYRAGVSFGNTGQVLRGEVSVGSLTQRFEDERLREISGVVVDANVAWRMSPHSSLLISARTDVGESTVAGSGGALVRSVGGEVRHAFRRHLVGAAGIRLTRADYAGIDLVEQDVTTTAGLEYFMSREATLFGRFAHVDYTTSAPASDYTADEVRLGLRVRR